MNNDHIMLEDTQVYEVKREDDLALIGVEYGYSDNRTGEKLRLERKADMKKRGLDSPDEGDALAYSFAERLAPTMMANSFEPDDSFEPD